MSGDDVIGMTVSIWHAITDPRSADLGELAWNLIVLAFLIAVAGFLLRILFDFLLKLWRIVVVYPYSVVIQPVFHHLQYRLESRRRARQQRAEEARSRKWLRYLQAKEEYEKWEREEQQERQRQEILKALKIDK